jgi:hypothetical protein
MFEATKKILEGQLKKIDTELCHIDERLERMRQDENRAIARQEELKEEKNEIGKDLTEE